MGLQRGVRQLSILVRKEALHYAREPLDAATTVLSALAAGAAVGVTARSFHWAPESLLAPGLALTMIYVSINAALHSFISDRESGALDGLRLSPVDPGLVALAKMVIAYPLILAGGLAYLASVAFLTGAWTPYSIPWTIASSLAFAAISGLAASILTFSEKPGLLAPQMVAALSLPYLLAATPPLNAAAAGLEPGGRGVAALAVPIAITTASVALARAALE